MESSFAMATTPQNSSDIILNQIKTSNPHFNINETPYSLYITTRKEFLMAPFPSTPDTLGTQESPGGKCINERKCSQA
jgi:hypothetical protein